MWSPCVVNDKTVLSPLTAAVHAGDLQATLTCVIKTCNIGMPAFSEGFFKDCQALGSAQRAAPRATWVW